MWSTTCELEVGAQLTINMALNIGKTTDAVEVKASAEQLETSTSTVGAVIATKRLLELALVGRNAYDLIGTQAGTAGRRRQLHEHTRIRQSDHGYKQPEFRPYRRHASRIESSDRGRSALQLLSA
ncbi:MAG: hypothetical protein M3Y27_28615 [Acidobacteriota bacterium]|nr:hypothetical protein [Acidobacteriota bacterium]